MAPSPAVEGIGERLRARLLATFCVVLIPVGLGSAFVQRLVVPGFEMAFLQILAAVAVFAAIYVLARSRHHCIAARLGAVVPVAMATAIGLSAPEDRIWYAFMVLGVLFAGMFATTRFAVLVAVAGAASIAVVSRLQPAFSDPGLWVPALFFFVGFSALLIVALRMRDRIDDARRRALADAQAVAARAQRFEAVAQLSAGLAHDFNNVLSALYGLIDELSDGGPAPREAVEDLRAVARKASDLTRKVADFGRRMEPRRDPLDLGRVVEAAMPLLDRLCRSDGVAVVYRGPDGPEPWIRGEAMLVEQILLNLVTNARDASRSGQTIRISVAAEGDEAVLRVADEGKGIEAAVLRRIFEPFFSTRGRGDGSGLGLAIVRRFTEQLGGTVRVDSRVGSGTTFEVRLPRIEPPRSEEHPVASSRPGAANEGRRILVVDDEPLVARAVARMAGQLGHPVDLETSAVGALARIEADPDAYAVLVTDVSMPEMGGGRLADRARALAPHLRVLFVSGQPEDTLVDLGVAPSPLNFLAKPFTEEQLAAKLRALSD